MNTPKRVGLKGVVATVTLFTLLQIVTTSGHGVQLMFQGNEVANHGFVLRGLIRDNPDDANPDTVIVQTDNTDCCTVPDGLSTGNCFYPNGTAVPTNSVGYDFFFDRRTQRVHLSRRRGGVLGIYRCSGVPDASGINCDRYVGIYSANTGRPLITSITFNLISELNAQTPRFTLTCISEGGPVERADWLRATTGGSSLQDGSTYDISGPTVVDTESAIYHHTLTVTGRLPDRYTCRVFSTRPQSAGGAHVDTMDIDVVAAHPPTIVSTYTELVGGTSCNDVRVTWTPPTGGATMTGYRIYYQAQDHQGFHDVEDGGATVDTVTGLLSGFTYTITMVARSQHLPSVASDSVTMAVGVPSIASLHFEMLSEVNATTPVFTLTCISQDGPVRRVQWIRNGETLNTDTNFDISQPMLVNISSLTYHSVLTVTGRLPGFYTCRVTSARTAVPGGRCSDNHSLHVGAPHSVTNLSARRIGCDTVTVSWTPPTGGVTVTGYRIYYQAEGHQEQNVTVNNPSTNEYNIRNLQVNLQYQITMVALSRHLPSPLAGPETVTIAPPPVRPNISLTVVSPTTVRVSWSPQPHVDHYEVTIERKNYTPEECPSFSHISDTTMIEKMDTDHTFQGLQEFSNYSITVRAVNLCGRPFSSQCITTPSAAPSAAPQTPTAQAISSTEIFFQWSSVPCIERNSRITAYAVHYGPVSNPGDIKKITVIGSSSDGGSYNINSLHPFTTYSIQVAAQNSDGETGPFSNLTFETTCQDVPGPVQSLSALPQATSIQVSWQVPNQTNGIIIAYEVHYWRNGEERQTENVTSGTSVELVALIPESEYTISVRAYTIAGPGPWRMAQSSTPKINPVENVEAVTVNATALNVSWNPTVLPGWTVTHYTVYYSAMSAQGNKIADEYTKVTPGNTTLAVVIAAEIFPDLVHQFQVTVSLEIEEEVFEGRKSPPLRITFDKALFQLQIGHLADCGTWMARKASRIKATLNSHLIKALSFHCNCSFSADFLREGAFTCWTTPTMTTYRSTIVGTKTHNASQLIAVLQQWVNLEPVLKIEHLYVKVNADCPASISSLGDLECS